jgi:phenylpyruvate tautomerase PptA (4-oxalocrotonate tautomerase family)
MPFVQITIMPQTLEKKTEMARIITDEIHRITNIPKDAITIGFYELPADCLANSGTMLTEKMKSH